MEKVKDKYNDKEAIIYESSKKIIRAGETTCFTCDRKFYCRYSFDPYNIEGDCLASK
jgi:hypothetical protein